jgi:hypothetical protein
MTGTPSARWRAGGQPDPHGTRFDCERSRLAHGNLTDDEIANAVFLHPENFGFLTAAKDRIRWLSRALEKLLAPPMLVMPELSDADKAALEAAMKRFPGRLFVDPAPQFTIGHFHNALRIMRSIDLHELQEKGLMVGADVKQWESDEPGDGATAWQLWLNFRADPYRYFIGCADEDAAKIFEIVEARQ